MGVHNLGMMLYVLVEWFPCFLGRGQEIPGAPQTPAVRLLPGYAGYPRYLPPAPTHPHTYTHTHTHTPTPPPPPPPPPCRHTTVLSEPVNGAGGGGHGTAAAVRLPRLTRDTAMVVPGYTGKGKEEEKTHGPTLRRSPVDRNHGDRRHFFLFTTHLDVLDLLRRNF